MIIRKYLQSRAGSQPKVKPVVELECVCNVDGSGEGRHDWPLWAWAENQDPGQWHAGCAAILNHVLPFLIYSYFYYSNFILSATKETCGQVVASNCDGLNGREIPLFGRPGSDDVSCWGCRNALHRVVASGDGETHTMKIVHCLTTINHHKL